MYVVNTTHVYTTVSKMANAGSTPNITLHITNIILALASFAAVSYGISKENQLYSDNLTRLHKTAHLHPTPCGFALPGVSELLDGIGLTTMWPRSSQEHESTAQDTRIGLCGSDSIHNMLEYLTRTQKVIDTDNQEEQDEKQFLDFLCGVHTRGSFGDIRIRIERTYRASRPAFIRLDRCLRQSDPDIAPSSPPSPTTSDSDEDGALVPLEDTTPMFKTDPFHKSICTQHGILKTEITRAVQESAGTIDTSKQVYRLMALAVAGYYDRTNNRNKCFGSYGKNATDLCLDVFTASENTITSVPIQEMCSERDSLGRGTDIDITQLESFSPPPPALGQLESCEATLQWGLYDLTRLFRVPDVTEPFEPDTSGGFWVLRPVYKALFRVHDMLSEYNTQQTDYAAQLRLYAAYRSAIVTARAMLGNSVMGFVIGFASVSTGLFLFARLQITDMRPNVRPPMMSLLPLVFICGVLFWVWGVWVDPYVESTPHYTSAQCADRSISDSGPWASTHDNPRAW